jgi:hypothetical protein
MYMKEPSLIASTHHLVSSSSPSPSLSPSIVVVVAIHPSRSEASSIHHSSPPPTESLATIFLAHTMKHIAVINTAGIRVVQPLPLYLIS